MGDPRFDALATGLDDVVSMGTIQLVLHALDAYYEREGLVVLPVEPSEAEVEAAARGILEVDEEVWESSGHSHSANEETQARAALTAARKAVADG